MRSPGVLQIAGAVLLCSCGTEEEQIPGLPQAPPSLPGALISPDGGPAAVAADSAIVLYYWLPLPGHASTLEDLAAIAGLAAGGDTAVFAVQLDTESRNSAQEQVNSLGVVLPVYLADSSVARSIPCDQLPVAVLFGAGGTRLVETGCGAVGRLLSR